MKRLAAVTLWILAGSALTGGVYWAFLNTPESTIWALMLSAALGVASLSLLAITANGALAGWSGGVTRDSFRQSVSRIPAIVPALAIVLILWWMMGRATGWVSAHSGEINAWFIARFGWDDVSGLFTGISWLADWVRWVVAPMLAVSVMAAVSAGGWPAVAQAAWITRALSPVRLGLASLWFALLVAMPWIYLAPWRPRGLPPTSIEFVFRIAKLSLTALLMAVGASLFIKQAAPS